MSNPEILCFGCIGQPGHYLHCKSRIVWRMEHFPWGNGIDGGLLDKRDTNPTGKWIEAHNDGWTVVSFWDRSGDSRPGSNTAFLCHADVTGEELIILARVQWPQVFARAGFPKLADLPSFKS